ncbi:hypothetical protein ABEW00_08030 [Rossellomorea vietnamensis]|uniref:hypothetical protein n=1 Tax=Rossellomorea vietnamensis TaxID=218284 RepID=UPI003D2BFDB9
MNDKMIELAIAILKETILNKESISERNHLRMLENFLDIGLFSDIYVVTSEIKIQKAEVILPYLRVFDSKNTERVEALM